MQRIDLRLGVVTPRQPDLSRAHRAHAFRVTVVDAAAGTLSATLAGLVVEDAECLVADAGALVAAWFAGKKASVDAGFETV